MEISYRRRLAQRMLVILFIGTAGPVLAGYLYGISQVLENTIQTLYRIDPRNGDLLRIDTLESAGGTEGLQWDGLTYNPADGYLYGIAQEDEGEVERLFRIDPDSAALIEIGQLDLTGPGSATQWDGLTYNFADGLLYGIGQGEERLIESLYKIDPSTAALTKVDALQIPGVPVALQWDGLAYNVSDGLLYGIGQSSEGLIETLYTIDPADAGLTRIDALGSTSLQWDGLAYNAKDGYLYGIGQAREGASQSLYRIDPDDAKLTTIGSLMAQGRTLQWDGCACLEYTFTRGDSNADGTVDVSDAVSTLLYLFEQGAVPPCRDAADANDSGAVDLGDAVRTLGYLFGGELPLPHPFGRCGLDATVDSLGCSEFAPCRPR